MPAHASAPELSPALGWVNSRPIRLAELRGRVVVLWFWHAQSAYCHNVLQDLQQLHARHGAGISIIGLHVPKFDAERDPRHVRKAVNRLGVRFPVAADPDFVAWQHYGIAGWPTLVVIGADGAVRRVLAGDGRRGELEDCVLQLKQDAAGPDAAPLEDPYQPVQHPEPRLALAFPSGIAVAGPHLYVADGGHHRVLECTHEGRVLRQFGAGAPGFLDGPGGDAAFNAPRGITVRKQALYVADTGNHALRRVQLDSGEVETVAGIGSAGPMDAGATQGHATQAVLNAPWDVAAGFDEVYIAMAGAQQVWAWAPGTRRLRHVAGSGRIGLGDGAAAEAAFAQPAALALVQDTLYVADAAGSAIRCLRPAEGQVQTLVGQGLFEFGDGDGARSAARLQAPCGLALDPDAPILWIADSGNDAVRMLRLGGGDLRRFDLDYRLQEPTAIAAAEGALWIASTAAHEIVRVDVESGAVRRLPVGE